MRKYLLFQNAEEAKKMGFPKTKYQVSLNPEFGFEVTPFVDGGEVSLKIGVGLPIKGSDESVPLEFPRNGFISISEFVAMAKGDVKEDSLITDDLLKWLPIDAWITSIDCYLAGKHGILMMVKFRNVPRRYACFFRGNNLRESNLFACDGVPEDGRFDDLTDRQVFHLFGGKD